MSDKRTFDLTGRVFGRLTVIECAGRNGRKNKIWRCRCDCGAETRTPTTASLLSGRTASCGGHSRENLLKALTRHGMAKSKGRGDDSTYATWATMRARCSNPNNHKWPDYGGRGIAVCKRWADYVNFLEDMGLRPGRDYSLDRIDNDGNYEPGNCRWATRLEQANNTRANLSIEYRGQIDTLAGWCRRLGLPYKLTWNRIRHRGWTIERAFAGAPEPGIDYMGQRKTLACLSREYGVPEARVKRRLGLGWELADALCKPITPGYPRNRKTVTHPH